MKRTVLSLLFAMASFAAFAQREKDYIREQKDLKDLKDQKDLKEIKDVKDPKEVKELKDPKELRENRQPAVASKGKELKEGKDFVSKNAENKVKEIKDHNKAIGDLATRDQRREIVRQLEDHGNAAELNHQKADAEYYRKEADKIKKIDNPGH